MSEGSPGEVEIHSTFHHQRISSGKTLEVRLSSTDKSFQKEGLFRSVNTSHNDLMMTLNAPRKIDCGLRSINSARYRRDYYINGDMEEVPKFKRLSSSSDTKESPSSPPFRTVTSTSHPKVGTGIDSILKSTTSFKLYYGRELRQFSPVLTC